jgi:hypothetical protein
LPKLLTQFNHVLKMVQYTNPELTDMVLIFGEAFSNAEASRRLHMERFPGRQVPCPRTFVNAVQHLRDGGTFNSINSDRGRSRSHRSWSWSLKLSSLTCPFCQWLLQKIDEEPNFLSIVLTTDEAGFTRDGVFNSYNTHIWSEENPNPRMCL